MALLQEEAAFSHVIAIDFGTGASGYGITHKIKVEKGKKPIIEVFNPCDETDDQKTVTAILFDNDKKFLAFGTQALQKYAEILDDNGTSLLFQTYKMHLFNLDKNAVSMDGREMPLITVISQSLKYIAEKAISKIKEQIGTIQLNKIRWVVTVPALWNEEHKQFMRKASVEAGIIDNINSQNLILCLEPEGASIHCREDAEGPLSSQLTKGKIVMVLDCGGGTVDITVHRLLCNTDEHFVCEEILPSSGGCKWGSKFVDQYFEKFLEEFLKGELYDYYIHNAMTRLEVLKHFEMIKRKFTGGDEKVRLQLSHFNEALSSAKLQELVNNYNTAHPNSLVKRGNSSIEMSQELMASFFLPLIKNIKDKVVELIGEAKKKASNIDFIFMVGGFSESPFLKAQIKKDFENDKTQVLVPRRPQVSVIRGACLFGLNPRSITSRISKRTYGINTLTTFDPLKHPEEKKVVIEGEDFCEDVFDMFVKKNESVGNDEMHNKTYCPVRSRQTVMRIIFYCADKENVTFIDEEGVTQLGELSIDIGRPFQSVEDKTVKVSLRFGSTYIYAKASNKDGTEERNCEFKFDCE